jgi:hypothetical protein
LKEALCSAAILAPPDYSRPFVLYCDASYSGFGVALHQLPAGKSERADERPVLFLSRTLNKHELNYAPTELEAACVIWALHKCRHFFEGSKLEIVTDHAALQWLKGCAGGSNRKLSRWSAILSEYWPDLTITHRPGVHHSNVDGLSRLIKEFAEGGTRVATVSTFRDQDVPWSELFAQDASLAAVYAHASRRFDAGVSDKDQWFLQEPNGRLFVRLGDKVVWVPPASMLADLTRDLHDSSGHFGYKKTHARMLESVFHPRLSATCRKICEECTSCLQNKPDRRKPPGLLQSIESPPYPFHSVAIDFVSALPISDGYTGFAAVTDLFSKVVRIIPTKSTTTAEIFAQLFVDNFVRYHGLPRVIISDRDGRFTSKFWDVFCSLTGIERAMTTAYHP